MPFFSVIIPTYNRRELLQQALESVWAQTFADYQVIVVDDGSSDGTWEYLEGLGNRVAAFRQKNAGPGAARNLGASQTRGRYLVFHDSDDMLTPWALETYHQAISRYPEVSHLIGNSYILDAPDAAAGASLRRGAYQDEYSSDLLRCSHANRIWASGLAVIEQGRFKEAGGFDVALHCHEDQDMSLKLACTPGFVRILSPATVCINQTEQSLSRGNLARIYEGISAIIEWEKSGVYPGGRERLAERRDYISVNIRNQSLALMQRGAFAAGWSLYRKSFAWHVKLLRFRYLMGFPVLWLRARLLFARTKTGG